MVVGALKCRENNFLTKTYVLTSRLNRAVRYMLVWQSSLTVCREKQTSKCKKNYKRKEEDAQPGNDPVPWALLGGQTDDDEPPAGSDQCAQD